MSLNAGVRLMPESKLKLLVLPIYLCACSFVLAQDEKLPTYAGHVNDFAEVMDISTEERLETLLRNFEDRTATQIAVVTLRTLNGRPIEEYANELYRAWGIGAKKGTEKDKGALLLVALQDRKTRLEVGYGLEGDLPDGLAGELIRRMRPHLQQQEYSQGLYVGTRTLVDTLAQKWNVSVEGIEDRGYAFSPDSAGGMRGSMFWILLVVVFLLLALGRNRRGGGGPGNYWWSYPVIFNRGGGTFGGGGWNSSGWGGGSSGGGWGGFGGGSSGGGGASDSW